MDETKVDTSSTLINERRPTVRKLVKKMASFCSIKSMDLGNLAGKHVFGVEKNFREMMNFLLADSPCNTRRDLRIVHEGYNVFGLTNMKCVAEVLGDVMKQRAH